MGRLVSSGPLTISTAGRLVILTGARSKEYLMPRQPTNGKARDDGLATCGAGTSTLNCSDALEIQITDEARDL